MYQIIFSVRKSSAKCIIIRAFIAPSVVLRQFIGYFPNSLEFKWPDIHIAWLSLPFIGSYVINIKMNCFRLVSGWNSVVCAETVEGEVAWLGCGGKIGLKSVKKERCLFNLWFYALARKGYGNV